MIEEALPRRELDVEEIRKDFPILRQLIGSKPLCYLDNGATTQKPQVVIDAITSFYEKDNANVHRGIHRLSQRATMAYEEAHAVVAEFIGACSEEVIFTRGATEGLNGLALSLGKGLSQGDEIVLTVMEHHSNLIPWLQLAKEKGLVIRYIPLTKEYRLDLGAARKMITSRTKVVSATQMSNVLGTLNPIKEIAALAHAVNAVCVVDAAQSVPHLPLNVKELNCDYLVFSAHKMCGPTGIGVLYGKKELLETLPPFAYGGGMVREVTFEQATWNDLPWKFEAGTPPLAEAIGLMAAVKYLQALGMKKIAKHSQELTAYGLQQLSTVRGLKIIGPPTAEQRGPIFSFILEEIHPHDVSELLDREGIAVRAGSHCAKPLLSLVQKQSTTRASLYLYNGLQEVDALVEGIKKIQAKFS